MSFNVFQLMFNKPIKAGFEQNSKKRKENLFNTHGMLSLRVELKTSRLLNGCSNQLSYESFLVFKTCFTNIYLNIFLSFHITQPTKPETSTSEPYFYRRVKPNKNTTPTKIQKIYKRKHYITNTRGPMKTPRVTHLK